ncbi:hypothetical protein [Streptomyces pini]|uniref:Uncharacterized protein n=1 Tax=Streptomyces pini TaxID=1520580 RepID=A0A1I4BZ08_9ACTN|nr:hypothetical protein [Streptomyces pini]SFK73753.1 hypothetical protein SAMN05192584_108186 [Streptomyces pini]
MAFRKTIPMRELRDRMSDADREQAATDYVPSRGGWLSSPKKKPVPGTPKGRSSR